MLDQPADAQRAAGGRGPGLLLGEAVGGDPQHVALLVEVGEQAFTLVADGATCPGMPTSSQAEVATSWPLLETGRFDRWPRRSTGSTRFRRPPGATEIFLVRHGESEPLVPGEPFPLVDGHGDPALAPDGHEQAERVADRLAAQHIDAIYVTTLRRTAQTAAPLAERLGITPRSSPTCARSTSASGRASSSASRWPRATRSPCEMFEEERWDVIPGGEPKDDFVARLRAGARAHRRRPPRPAGRRSSPTAA